MNMNLFSSHNSRSKNNYVDPFSANKSSKWQYINLELGCNKHFHFSGTTTCFHIDRESRDTFFIIVARAVCNILLLLSCLQPVWLKVVFIHLLWLSSWIWGCVYTKKCFTEGHLPIGKAWFCGSLLLYWAGQKLPSCGSTVILLC